MENIEKPKKTKAAAKKAVTKKPKQTKAKTGEKVTAKKEAVKKKAAIAKEKDTVKTEAAAKQEANISDNTQDNKSERPEATEFWNETKENVVEGAKVISEEAKKWGKKLTSYSETIFGKIKENTSEVFKYGLDLTNDGVHKAQDMAERLKDNFEIRKLNAKKHEVSAQLGIKTYLAIKNNNNEIPTTLMQDTELVSLLKELEEIDKSIIKLSEELEK